MARNRTPVIRVIASDWGKVIADFDNMRMAEAFATHSSSFDGPHIHGILLHEQREIYDAYMRGQLTTAGFRKAAKRILQLTCTDAAFDAIFVDVFTRNEPMIAWQQAMRAQGVKLVAASNVEELRHAKLRELGIHDLFDAHCLSYIAKANKPEPEFFHEVARQAYISPEQILFIDDHAEFVEVARSQLMQGIAYDLKDHAAFEKAIAGYVFERYQR